MYCFYLIELNCEKLLKFFLHISKEEQKSRLLKRLDDPAKHWKFDVGDLDDRGRWDEYMDANGVRVMSKVKFVGLQHGVPDILRWWLTEYNILALPGVGKLRPMRAQWWG
ncbi:MAG: hypothetical protein EOO77_31120 [Oxalobacteraceae bacterium]|nr:MAG: hypothetical protein EOO77_31120 [Oxalobacteraceae bacterium]